MPGLMQFWIPCVCDFTGELDLWFDVFQPTWLTGPKAQDRTRGLPQARAPYVGTRELSQARGINTQPDDSISR